MTGVDDARFAVDERGRTTVRHGDAAATDAAGPTVDDDATGDSVSVDPGLCEDEVVTSAERSAPGWDPPDSTAYGEGTGRTTQRDSSSASSSDVRAASPAAAATTPGKPREWSLESARAVAEWWFRPVVQPASWLALAYLLAGAVLGPLLFVATLVVVVVTASLSLVGIGLLLVVPSFANINAMAALERRRPTWIGEAIAPRRLRKASGRSWSAVTTRLGDPGRWRQVAYLLAMVVTGPVFFVVGVSLWAVTIQLVGGLDLGAITIPALMAGIALSGAAARLTAAVAGVARSYTAWFLGPDPTDDLEERVVELATQREQILDAVAGERRRIERNLHDGVQQQLVALGIDIGRAQARLDDDPDGARDLLSDAREKVRGSIGELRMIGRGLHPAVLSDRGLDAALSAVVAGAPIPISVEVSTDLELPVDLAETAYYVVNEAVANVLKHARARTASVRVTDEPGVLPAVRITVHDDGRGAAAVNTSSGSGLAGIAARVQGADGVFHLDSPAGGPTELTAVLPIRRARSDERSEP